MSGKANPAASVRARLLNRAKADNAAKLLLVGMLAIAAGLFFSQGFYVVVGTSENRAGPSAIVVNKFTGTAQLCRLKGCEALLEPWDVVSEEPAPLTSP